MDTTVDPRSRPVTPLQLRRVDESDAEPLRALLTGLSPRTAFLRFHAGIGSPSGRLVSGLLRRDRSHGAWVASDGPTLLGHVSWAVVAEGVVEVGAVVADGWQRRGLGRALLDVALGEAAGHGAGTVRMHVHPENADLLRRLAAGAATVRQEDTTVVVERPLQDLRRDRGDLFLVA